MSPRAFSISLLTLLALVLVLRSVTIAGSPQQALPNHVAAQSTAPAAAGDPALFTAFVGVLRHPRCMNCHSKGDFPRQGDDGHRHTMNVRRGPAGYGVTAVTCNTCHQDHNLAGEHLPPGAPSWALPPPEEPMIWEGLTDAQLCRSILDPKQNHGRSLNETVKHLTEDKLVAWG